MVGDFVSLKIGILSPFGENIHLPCAIMRVCGRLSAAASKYTRASGRMRVWKGDEKGGSRTHVKFSG